MDEEGGDRSSGDLKAAAAHSKWGDARLQGTPPDGGSVSFAAVYQVSPPLAGSVASCLLCHKFMRPGQRA